MAPRSENEPSHHKTVAQHIAGVVPVLDVETSLNNALSAIQKNAHTFEDISYIYVVDKNKKFVGVVALSALLQASNKKAPLGASIQKDFPTIHQHTHQEHALRLAIERNVLALPVVDKTGTFAGALTPKDLMSILKEEHVEDMLHFGGIHTTEQFVDVFKAKVGKLIRLRLPWLLIGLAGGMAATFIARFFASALEHELALAFFIPVIVYMSAAVGAQTQTLYIRGIALEKVNLKKYIGREISVSLVIGFITSVLIGIFAYTAFRDISISIIVGAAMFINTLAAVLLAVLIPWALAKAGKDPAIGAGPFATIIQDILSLVVYFSVASLILFS